MHLVLWFAQSLYTYVLLNFFFFCHLFSFWMTLKLKLGVLHSAMGVCSEILKQTSITYCPTPARSKSPMLVTFNNVSSIKALTMCSSMMSTGKIHLDQHCCLTCTIIFWHTSMCVKIIDSTYPHSARLPNLFSVCKAENWRAWTQKSCGYIEW